MTIEEAAAELRASEPMRERLQRYFGCDPDELEDTQVIGFLLLDYHLGKQ